MVHDICRKQGHHVLLFYLTQDVLQNNDSAMEDLWLPSKRPKLFSWVMMEGSDQSLPLARDHVGLAPATNKKLVVLAAPRLQSDDFRIMRPLHVQVFTIWTWV